MEYIFSSRLPVCHEIGLDHFHRSTEFWKTSKPERLNISKFVYLVNPPVGDYDKDPTKQ